MHDRIVKLRQRHSLYTSRFKWGEPTDLGVLRLKSNIRHMLRYIKQGNADKAAARAQDAAHVARGIIKWVPPENWAHLTKPPGS